jgi:zinc D-Ala-D-Ala dipeptidase
LTTRATVKSIRVEDIVNDPAFVRLATLAHIDIDLRYAGTDNFAGRVLYAGIDGAWLRAEAAHGLARAAAWLARHHPGQRLRLRVLDALRPHRVQQAIWRDVAGTPAAMYFADPALGSIHSHGMALDVTLLDAENREIDMGSGYDEMSERSHPALEDAQLAAGAITAAHIDARQLLRRAMHEGGFQGIATEWWHFNHGDPQRVRRELPRVA